MKSPRKQRPTPTIIGTNWFAVARQTACTMVTSMAHTAKVQRA